MLLMSCSDPLGTNCSSTHLGFHETLTFFVGWKCWGFHALGHGLEATTDGSRCVNVPSTCPSSRTTLAHSTLSGWLSLPSVVTWLLAHTPGPSFSSLSHFPPSLLMLAEITSQIEYLHSNPCLQGCFWGKSSQDTGERFPLTGSSLWHLILCPTHLAMDSKHVKAESAEIPIPRIYFM